MELGGELLVLTDDEGGLRRFDRIAAAIWPHLDGDVTIEELTDGLATGFRVDPDVVRHGIREFLTRLSEEALLCADGPHVPEREGPVEAWGYLADPPSP